jgi:dolichol-phosphate mannosyltransferase
MKTIVVVPTYNEKENIANLIKEILKVKDVDVLVVDDNSPDGTWKIVKGMADKRVNLLLRTKNRGRGLAGIAGFKYAVENKYDYIIEMDADFSHDPKYIPDFLEKIKECDVVLGSRAVKGGKQVGRPLLRRLITRLANLYIRILLGLKVNDCNSGYRCFKRKVLESINLDTMISRGPSIVQEVLYKVRLKGFKIREIPIVFTEREEGSSKLGPYLLWKGYVMVLKLRFLRLVGRI